MLQSSDLFNRVGGATASRIVPGGTDRGLSFRGRVLTILTLLAALLVTYVSTIKKPTFLGIGLSLFVLISIPERVSVPHCHLYSSLCHTYTVRARHDAIPSQVIVHLTPVQNIS
jgi:hypothetical protein